MELSSRLVADHRAWAERGDSSRRRKEQDAEVQPRNQLREVRSGIDPHTKAEKLASGEHRPDLAV